MSKGIILDAQQLATVVHSCTTLKERKEVCTNKRKQLVEKYKTTTVIGYLTIYRKELQKLNLSEGTLKALFECLKVHKAKSQSIKRAYKEKVYKRTEQGEAIKISVTEISNIIEFAKGLLSHRSYYKVALGVLLLTGRRTAEILLTADFKAVKGSKMQAVFSGQAKKRGLEITYNIPLLAPFEDITKAIQYLQTTKVYNDVTDVHTKAANPLMIANKESIKRSFPFVDTVHDLRKLYAAICYYKFGKKQSFRTYASALLGHSDNDSLGSAITTETYFKYSIQ